MSRAAGLAAAFVVLQLTYAPANGALTIFFDSSQVATLVSEGETSDTISSNGYLFTYTRDKLFTGGTGQPIGRPVRVPWPEGVEAQAVTTPPPGVTDHKARITLQRVDGNVFDMTTFTVKLLANTGGAGAAIEIMPLVNGEDAFADPLALDVTGYYGQNFSFGPPSTSSLAGYDTYKISLYVDFAFVALTLQSDDVLGDLNGDTSVDLTDLGLLLGDYGCTGSSCIGDINYDGVTNLTDLGILLANYGM